MVPLGYRVDNRALHVVEEHAAFVRDLFRRYLKAGSVVRLKAALDQENVRLPHCSCLAAYREFWRSRQSIPSRNISRSLNFWILPDGVAGSASRTISFSGMY